ncbi:uncharacterized protein LOC133525298 [Cydia pomonella]|uniref:uncharacterized protein LOC133525298 n=1 Tax=Cydia pomonella TaxID=82600 RepID=UPI002ADD4991|nr:uncharacterized protein LOC133525298 [Cydia pomonella]
MNIKQKSFKILNLTENVFGIYRNISTFSKLGKTIAVTVISIELSLCLYIVFTKFNHFKYLYTCLAQLNSILSILSSCYYSKSYVKLLRCLKANDILVDFQKDEIYFKRLASYFKIGLFRLCAYLTFFCLMLIITEVFNVYIQYRKGEERILTLARVLSIMRLHVECNCIYYTFHTLSEQLQCITRSVVRSKLFYHGDSDQMINVEKWRQYYTNVKESTELFNKIYDQKKLRTVKQLIQIVSSRPIKVKTFGGIDVNMALVPACLTVVASYTIVTLQFNNVV